MCAAAAGIKKQLLQALTLPTRMPPPRRQWRLRPQRRHFDEQGGPSVRYYQQFVLRSHTFHASYLLQHYYIAATCRSEPLSKMSSLQEAQAVRLHLQWSKLKKTKQVWTCRLWWWLTARSMIICTLIPNGISRDDALLNGHFQVLSSSIPEIVTPFLNYDALPKKKKLHHGKDQVLAHPWKKKQKFIPLWPTQDDKIDTSPALKKENYPPRTTIESASFPPTYPYEPLSSGLRTRPKK